MKTDNLSVLIPALKNSIIFQDVLVKKLYGVSLIQRTINKAINLGVDPIDIHIITESEDRIFNFVQLPEQRKNVQGTTESGNRFLSCPTDFLAPMSLAVISVISDPIYGTDFPQDPTIKRNCYIAVSIYR